jgi:zinc protease
MRDSRNGGRLALVCAATWALGGAACGGSMPHPTPATPVMPDSTGSQPADEPGPPLAVTAPVELPDPVFPQEAFRQSRPEAGEPRPFKLPSIRTFALAGGIQVYLVERHALPTVAVTLKLEGGGKNDPVGKEGLAAVCMELLSEGTKELDKLAFSEALADIASSVSSYASTEEQGISMSTLSAHLDTTLELWADTILEPGFRQAELDRMIRRRLEALKQTKGSAASVAGRLSDSIVYGADHPYGRVATEASYQAIHLDDCIAYHAAQIRPKGARLFVVGDMTEAQIRAQVGKRLAKWRGAPRRQPKVGRPSPRAGRVFFVDVPKSAQSSVALMHLGPKRNAKDYFATAIMSRILGGGFASRINMNLREDKGYTYGAGGGFGYSREGSVFSAGGSFVTEKTKEAVLELIAEVRALHAGKAPATADEMAREREGAILSLPAGFATAAQTLAQYDALVFYGLPLDYYATYVDRVGAVTADHVTVAAAKHLAPDDARLLVVGDHDSVLPGLRQLVAAGTLGAGDLVVLDADGAVVETITAEQAAEAPTAPPAP